MPATGRAQTLNLNVAKGSIPDINYLVERGSTYGCLRGHSERPRWAPGRRPRANVYDWDMLTQPATQLTSIRLMAGVHQLMNAGTGWRTPLANTSSFTNETLHAQGAEKLGPQKLRRCRGGLQD